MNRGRLRALLFFVAAGILTSAGLRDLPRNYLLVAAGIICLALGIAAIAQTRKL